MTDTPIIGITCDHDAGLRSNAILIGKRAHFLMDDYIEAVMCVGCLPMLLPMGMGTEMVEKVMDTIDGLLISGSFNDVDPALFGEEPHPRLFTLNPSRTQLEIELIRAALERDKPLMGICGGMQTINVALGGGMIQDIPSQVKGAHQHGQRGETARPFHSINIAPDTLLYRISDKERIRVNSTHHQAVDTLAPGLMKNAWAQDDVTEGIEKPDQRFCLGVQWHPEQMTGTDEISTLIFKSFAEHAMQALREK